MPFSDVFDMSTGRIVPRAQIQIGGLKIAPGLTVPPSVHVMIVELATVIGHDLEITQDPITGLVTITGYH